MEHPPANQTSVDHTTPANQGAHDEECDDEETYLETKVSPSVTDTNSWQGCKPTILARVSYLFNNEKLADVHFVVGREASMRVPAHRFVLSVGSAVFEAMFYGILATKADEIELPDIEPAAFLALLKYLYSDEVDIGPETVMTTLYTAKKYAVPALEAHCVDFLKSNLGADNAFMLLSQARLFDEPQLAALCLDTIDRHTGEALAADGFTDLDLPTLRLVLRRDTLRVPEAKLFEAVIRWCESECGRRGLEVTGTNMREVLGAALYLLRFPLMMVEEFASGAAQSGLLTDREVVTLFLYFTLNPKPATPFKDVQRYSVTGQECVVSRFQAVEHRWGYSGSSDRISFTVDRKIFVVGFGLYGCFLGMADYVVDLEVTSPTGSCLGYNQTGFSSDGSAHTFRVMFKSPIEIHPSIRYIASVTLRGPDSHYGTRGQWKVPVECPGGRVTFQFNYATGNNNGTSIDDGQIPEILFYI